MCVKYGLLLLDSFFWLNTIDQEREIHFSRVIDIKPTSRYITFILELLNRNVTRVLTIISLTIIYSFYLLLEYIYDLKVKRYACKQETHDAEKLL